MSDATITSRKATPNDAADLAIPEDLAGNGLPRWLWQGAVNSGKADNAFVWRRSRMKSDDIYGWRSSRIAEADGNTAGKLTGYTMPVNEDFATDVPPLIPIFKLMEKMKVDWYVDALAVYLEFRRWGVASKLIKDAITTAKAKKVAKIGLIVSSSNDAAVSLYRKFGFSDEASLPIIGFDGKEKQDEKHCVMVQSL